MFITDDEFNFWKNRLLSGETLRLNDIPDDVIAWYFYEIASDGKNRKDLKTTWQILL